MTAPALEEYSAELLAWLARADAQISVDERRWPGAFASLDGGERVFLVDREADGWLAVSMSNRGGDPEPRFRTPSFEVVERFLASEAGPAARFLAGVPGRVFVPFEITDLRPGTALRRITDGPLGGVEELTVGDVVVGEFGFGPSGRIAHSSAVRASYWGTATLAQIVESHLSPDGSPLFTVRAR
jgi:Immunity protein 61